MKILFAASECSPIVKVGGLGDVAGSLPLSLKKIGADISVVIPFYKEINKDINFSIFKERVILNFKGKTEEFNVWQTKLENTTIYLIENTQYISNGGVYVKKDASASNEFFEAERFLFFSLAVIRLGEIIKAKIIHCNDWHTAIIPYLVKERKLDIKTILTIHNLQYQGVFLIKKIKEIISLNNINGKKINFLKVGIEKADIITTVSPIYAKEILTKKFGFGLNKILAERKKDLIGIINGLDAKEWNPETDKLIINFSLKSIKNKLANKEKLQTEFFKMKNKKIPLLAIISRLAEQKGIDLLLKILPQLMVMDIQLVILGEGNEYYEKQLSLAEKKWKGKLKFINKFDNELAHQIYAASDIFLMPSLFEPCGLGQQIAMKYGSIPVARAVGGLKDIIINIKAAKRGVKGTGFLFEKYSPSDFLSTIKKALFLFQNRKAWKKIQENAMNNDFSWQKSAKKYLKLYKKIIA